MTTLSPYIVRFRRNIVRPDLLGFEIGRIAALLRASAPPYHRFSHAIQGFAAVLDESLVARVLAQESGIVEAIERDWPVRAFAPIGPIGDLLGGGAGYPLQQKTQTIPEGLRRIGGLQSSAQIGSRRSLAGKGVHMFVLDTGVDSRHADINVVESRSFVPTEPAADDLNGHGTMAAGVAAARDNDGHVVGVAPDVPIHGYKVLGATGSGSISNIVAALDAVIAFRLRSGSSSSSVKGIVVNMSLGGDVGTREYTSLDLAVTQAVTVHGIVVVAAAGNETQDAGTVSPAHAREAITVGSYDWATDKFSSFSNFGDVVDLLAPGERILTTAPGNRTDRADGTSFSCPYVAGAAALYLANRNPRATPSEVARALCDLAADPHDGANPRIAGVPPSTPTISLFVARL
jgi:subtilisin family serine protease